MQAVRAYGCRNNAVLRGRVLGSDVGNIWRENRVAVVGAQYKLRPGYSFGNGTAAQLLVHRIAEQLGGGIVNSISIVGVCQFIAVFHLIDTIS